MEKLLSKLKKLTNEQSIHGALKKLSDDDFILGLTFEDMKTFFEICEHTLMYSMHDPNTLLLHKQTFITLVKEKIKTEPNYLIFIDVDNFKKINDKYGHLVGDDILNYIARILNKTFRIKCEKSIRNQDLVARYGGDEFIIFMSECFESVVQKKLEKLNKLLSIPYQIDEYNDFNVKLSINYVKYNENLSFDENFKKVDELVYKEKQQKKYGL